MTDQTVKSLAGEDVIVFDDDAFATLAGLEPRSHSCKLSMSLNQSKLAVLKALWRHGRVVDRSGFAVGHLAERIRSTDEFDVNLTPILATPLMQQAVERVTRGKRTMEISLVALPRSWWRGVEGALAEQPMRDAVDRAGSAVHERSVQMPLPELPYSQPEPTPEPAPAVDTRHDVEHEVADAVATALMARFVEIIANGGTNVVAAKNAQLTAEVGTLSRRLGEQTSYVERLRRDLRAAQDEVGALKSERDGLRQRAQAAEHNLKVATGADAQRIINDEVHRQVDRMMRQAPGPSKDSGAA